MTDYTANPANFCYRHPNRQSFVLCQRCGRTICPECQTLAPVGVICPECMREQGGSAPRQPRQQYARSFGGGGGTSYRAPGPVRRVANLARAGHPVMTYAIMAANVLGFVLSLVPAVANAMSWSPAYFAPWELVTSIFVTTSFLSIVFNLLTLWFMGRTMESMLGPWRFLVVYLLSGMTGGVVMLLFAHFYTTGGAYASVFGMFGVLMMVQRKLGAGVGQMLVWVGINLVLNLFLGSWLTIFIGIGGLAGGVVVGLILTETRQIRQRNTQIGLLVLFAVVLFAIGCFPMVVH